MVQLGMEVQSCSRHHPKDFAVFQVCSRDMIAAKLGTELPEHHPACKVSDWCSYVVRIRENQRLAAEKQRQAVV